MDKSGPFSELKDVQYTSRDIRFTVKGDVLYAIMLGWPQKGQSLSISSLARKKGVGKIGQVSLLGEKKPVQWKQSSGGLEIIMPEEKPCEHACTLKIEFSG